MDRPGDVAALDDEPPWLCQALQQMRASLERWIMPPAASQHLPPKPDAAAPLASSHPADLAERIIADFGAALINMDDERRGSAVRRLDGLPLARGGHLRVTERREARALSHLRERFP